MTSTETLANFGVPLVERPEILADIAYKYAQRGREMTPSNRKQALIKEQSFTQSNWNSARYSLAPLWINNSHLPWCAI